MGFKAKCAVCGYNGVLEPIEWMFHLSRFCREMTLEDYKWALEEWLGRRD